MTAHTDYLVRNAAVCTMDPRQPWAEALAVREGRLAAVGSLAQARAAVPGAREIDLRGRMVMPGLIDVHNHFVFAGRSELYETLFPPILPLAQVLDLVRAAAAGKAPGEWIVGGIWSSGLLPELTPAARRAGRTLAARAEAPSTRNAAT